MLSCIEGDSLVPINEMTNEPILDVAACVERVRQSDEDAARSLMRHLYPLVIKLIRGRLPCRTSEDDMAQIVFMKIFANLDRYSGTVPLEHWVSRIAINACLNQIAAEKSRPELRLADLSEEQCEVIESLAATADELQPDQSLAARELVEKLLALLEPRDRLLLTLLHLEGRSAREVQQITGWNGIVIRVRAYRARQKLKGHFQKLMKEEQP
jgi:RNA polymerase sigma-70 factor, ECF subfamily